MKKIIVAILGLSALLFSSGCASIVIAQIKGKMPITAAEELSVSVNIVGAGGGSIAVTGVKRGANGELIAATYDEQINTGAGSLTIKGRNVELPAPK